MQENPLSAAHQSSAQSLRSYRIPTNYETIHESDLSLNEKAAT